MGRKGGKKGNLLKTEGVEQLYLSCLSQMARAGLCELCLPAALGMGWRRACTRLLGVFLSCQHGHLLERVNSEPCITAAASALIHWQIRFGSIGLSPFLTALKGPESIL